MKTNQLIVRSAVTVVATGLSVLASSNSQAHGRGPSAGHFSSSRGSRMQGTMHQSLSSHAMTRMSAMRGDDHGRHHERGDDRGRNNTVTRGERERGDDHGRHHERGDDRGRNNSVARGERERGDDHGRHHERGDDRGGRR